MVAVVELGELTADAVVVAGVGTADCTGHKDCWIWVQKAETLDQDLDPRWTCW